MPKQVGEDQSDDLELDGLITFSRYDFPGVDHEGRQTSRLH